MVGLLSFSEKPFSKFKNFQFKQFDFASRIEKEIPPSTLADPKGRNFVWTGSSSIPEWYKQNHQEISSVTICGPYVDFERKTNCYFEIKIIL